MAEEGNPEEEGGGGGGLMKIIIPVVALLLGVGGGYFLGDMMAAKETAEAAQAEPEDTKKPEDIQAMVGDVFPLEDFLVNLNEGRGNRYLKATIELELDTEELRPEVERRQPQIRDVILSLLGSKGAKELMDAEGKFRLREEILSRINAVLVNGNVKRVYFTAFVIQ
ncbi:flagellar basal body-associated FliL family protein [Magnetococcus sp. PR-3]|uniref:flagellar basal body-associated FliL family protein n=1 Tax=Magnetococcus sp. PR-3 TaxID=3120355 RepID=UPI002FCDEB13